MTPREIRRASELIDNLEQMAAVRLDDAEVPNDPHYPIIEIYVGNDLCREIYLSKGELEQILDLLEKNNRAELAELGVEAPRAGPIIAKASQAENGVSRPTHAED